MLRPIQDHIRVCHHESARATGRRWSPFVAILVAAGLCQLAPDTCTAADADNTQISTRPIEPSGGLAARAGGLRIAQAPTTTISPITPSYRAPEPTRRTRNTIDTEARIAAESSQRTDLPRSLFEPTQSLERAHVAWGVSDLVAGDEAIVRQSDDVGSLLFGAQSANGIATQQRNAVTYDVRIRGAGNSQNIGAGSYWNPGRPDLDTALNKIFAYNLEHLLVVKGPYAVRYGPGFNFVEMQLRQSPRNNVPGWNGTTSLNFDTNGDRWSARQSIWGGGQDWGAHVSYGHSAGSDYEDGAGFLIPNSYKSRDVYATIGRDLSKTQSLEVSYIRLDQTDVEFPGLVFDLNFLVTDAFEVEYHDKDPAVADRFDAEFWYNRTRFEGDTLRPSKNRQIPSLRTLLFSPDGVSGFATTDVDGSSVGYRLGWSWDVACAQFTMGTDLIYLDQTLNDREPFLPDVEENFPVPHSNSADIGFFAEYSEQLSDDWSVNLGGRTDFIQTRSSDFVPGVPFPLSELNFAGLDQSFTLWAAYATTEWEVDSHWTAHGGVGFSQRPPTLTELYAEQSFIGTLQRGLTYVDGDPLLDPERLKQIDVGLRWNYETFRGSVSAFHGWISDYITYDLNAPGVGGGFTSGVTYLNTSLATLSGFEVDSIYDVDRSLSVFGKLQFVEGRDRGRDRGAPLLGGGPRSGLVGRTHEPLPGIAPLEARIGFRLHDPSPAQLWGTEVTARIVDKQDRIAASLEEVATPGFTVWDIRSYWKLTDNVLALSGVENLTDKFYQEHLDYRSGFGVFRRGVSYYAGIDVSY